MPDTCTEAIEIWLIAPHARYIYSIERGVFKISSTKRNGHFNLVTSLFILDLLIMKKTLRSLDMTPFGN